MTDSLAQVFSTIGPATVAVSGGVDSMTLAVFAHRVLGRQSVTMMHAASPAVPQEATQRVRDWAAKENWSLEIINAGEFTDENYRKNPVNRCFFCKGNLYGTIAKHTEAQILSGANTDDLGEYRPGLDAARSYNVRHPYLEAQFDKQAVRALARQLGLGDLSALPASPCLSSRVETLIPIEPETLEAIHAVERLLLDQIMPDTVRCRVRKSGIVIELDTPSLLATDDAEKSRLSAAITSLMPPGLTKASIEFAPYKNGSAFIGTRI